MALGGRKGFNFKHPALNDADLFNRTLWKGIMGDDKPYPRLQFSSRSEHQP
jgi:hypothetical protein